MAMPLERDSGTTGWYYKFYAISSVTYLLVLNFSGNNSGMSFIFKTVIVSVCFIVVKFLKMPRKILIVPIFGYSLCRQPFHCSTVMPYCS